VAAARRVIGIELVLEARMAASPATSSSWAKMRSFSSTFSVAASIRRSASAGSAAVWIRSSAASRVASSRLPLSVSFASDASMPDTGLLQLARRHVAEG
jgi:hypothetical protein